MQATLTAPLTLNPLQATALVIRMVHIEPAAQVLTAEVDLVDGSGNILDRRRVQLDGAGVQTWISNNMLTLYNTLLTKLGVTGTVA